MSKLDWMDIFMLFKCIIEIMPPFWQWHCILFICIFCKYWEESILRKFSSIISSCFFSKATMLYNLWILVFPINQCSMISLPSSFQTLTQGLIIIIRPNHPTQPSLAWTSSQSEESSLHCTPPSTVTGLHLLYHLTVLLRRTVWESVESGQMICHI